MVAMMLKMHNEPYGRGASGGTDGFSDSEQHVHTQACSRDHDNITSTIVVDNRLHSAHSYLGGVASTNNGQRV
jgi:hypothetical protein